LDLAGILSVDADDAFALLEEDILLLLLVVVILDASCAKLTEPKNTRATIAAAIFFILCDFFGENNNHFDKIKNMGAFLPIKYESSIIISFL
jgi:hypothetical protein